MRLTVTLVTWQETLSVLTVANDDQVSFADS